MEPQTSSQREALQAGMSQSGMSQAGMSQSAVSQSGMSQSAVSQQPVTQKQIAPQLTHERVALITGASRGIGAAVARVFASQGYWVALNHSGEHSAAATRSLAVELQQAYGVEAQAFMADVSQFDDAKNLVKAVQKHFGRIDVCVNNAGITADGLLIRMKEEAFDRVIDINLKGTFNCMRHVSLVMMKQHYGRIVNVASVVGLAGNAGQVNYAASKAGIIGMTKSAAKELAARGVTVNAVAPGFIQTDMTDALSAEIQDAIRDRIAAGEFGTPEDVAYAIAFLASPEARYITGQVLGIDGGIAL